MPELPRTERLWRGWMAHTAGQGLSALLADGLVRHVPGLDLLAACGNDADSGRLPPGLSAETFRKLGDAYLTCLRRNLIIHEALTELDRHLGMQGITCLLWKGAHLAQGIYPDAALRPMEDADLLVPCADMPHLKRLLRRLGYASPDHLPALWSRDGVIFDLHADAVNSDRIAARMAALPLTADALAETARPVDGFENLKSPSAVDTLICLTAHLVKHSFSKDIWAVDLLAVLAHHHEILSNPGMLLRRARRLGVPQLPRFLPVVLSAWPHELPTEDLFGQLAPLPPLLARRIAPDLERGVATPYIGELAIIWLQPGMIARLRYLMEVFWPDSAVAQETGPGRDGTPMWRLQFNRLARIASRVRIRR